MVRTRCIATHNDMGRVELDLEFQCTRRHQSMGVLGRREQVESLSTFTHSTIVRRSHFERIDSIVQGGATSNNGFYTFTPRTLAHNPRIRDAWKRFTFGFVQVRVYDNTTHQKTQTMAGVSDRLQSRLRVASTRHVHKRSGRALVEANTIPLVLSKRMALSIRRELGDGHVYRVV